MPILKPSRRLVEGPPWLFPLLAPLLLFVLLGFEVGDVAVVLDLLSVEVVLSEVDPVDMEVVKTSVVGRVVAGATTVDAAELLSLPLPVLVSVVAMLNEEPLSPLPLLLLAIHWPAGTQSCAPVQQVVPQAISFNKGSHEGVALAEEAVTGFAEVDAAPKILVTAAEGLSWTS